MMMYHNTKFSHKQLNLQTLSRYLHNTFNKVLNHHGSYSHSDFDPNKTTFHKTDSLWILFKNKNKGLNLSKFTK